MTTPEQAATQRLARFVSGTTLADIPDDVARDAARLIADTIGVAIGGYQVEAGQIVSRAAEGAFAGAGRSTVLGSGRVTSPAEAAFVNAYLANVLDADDVFINTSHPAACALVPALALAESEGLSGAELLVAFVVAYEASVRIGLSLVRSRLTVDNRIERASSLGMGWYAFSAAASAARALKLGPEGVAQTFGVAAAASPIGFARRWQSIESRKYMMKYTPNGFIASNGVTAAMLVSQGFTADRQIFDGPFSYWEISGAFGSTLDELIADLGSKWWLSESTIKPWAIGGAAIATVELVSKLMAEHALTADAIEAIQVETFETSTLPWFTGSEPAGQIDMGFSLPLGAAAAALGIELGPRWQEDHLHDERLLALARRVQVSLHPEANAVLAEQVRADGRIRRIPNRVTIRTAAGSVSAACETHKGDPWSPATRLSDEEVRAKFALYTADVLGQTQASKLWDVLYDLPNISSVPGQVSELLRQDGFATN